MAFMDYRDPISGKLASAFVTIDGRVEELLYAKSLESSMEMNTSDIPILGKTNVAKKPAGWTGTGSMTIYYVTSLFRQMALEYAKTGKAIYFDLQTTNEDPTSSIGRQTVVLKGCTIDKLDIAKFDITTDDQLDEEVTFTYSDFDLPESFK